MPRSITAGDRQPDRHNPVTQAIQNQLNQHKIKVYEETFDTIEEQQKKLGTQIEKLSDLRRLIADYTRKPLTGIPEIFLNLHHTLADARTAVSGTSA